MKIRLIIVLLFVFSIHVSAQERGFQIWNINSVSAQLTNRTSLGIKEKMHFTPGSGNIDLIFGDLSLGYDVNTWLEAGVGGRLMVVRKEQGWMQEKRPMVFGNISGTFNKLELDFSNRMEYRLFETANDHFRHRQMLTVEMPPFSVSWFSVYIAEEGFFRFDQEKLHLARIYAGTKIHYSETLEMKVYYVLEKQKHNSDWSPSDAVGLNMYVSF